MKRIITLRIDDKETTVTAYREGEHIVVEREGERHRVQVIAEKQIPASQVAGTPGGGTATSQSSPAAGSQRPGAAAPAPASAAPTAAGGTGATGAAAPADTEGATPVAAPMTGVIKEVAAGVGAAVNKGDRVVVMEAMKMDVYVNAPIAGVVHSVTVQAGDAVNGGRVLLTIKGEGA